MGIKDSISKAGYRRFFGKEKLKISFCTTCMDRLDYLKDTLVYNLNNVRLYSDFFDYEFVLVNYNSKDETEKFVRDNLGEYLDSGLLKYYKTFDPEKFHMAHAKNVAHKLATGDILINLDSDIYILGGFIDFIRDKFTNDKIVITASGMGKYGVNAISKNAFDAAGGYDEEFFGWGPEDSDLLNRLYRYGCVAILWPKDVIYHIDHPDDIRGWDSEVFVNNKLLKDIHDVLGTIVVNESGYGKCDLVEGVSPEIYLLSCIGVDYDLDLIEHFISYYMNEVGVDHFFLILHSNFNNSINMIKAKKILEDFDIDPVLWEEEWSERLKMEKLKQLENNIPDKGGILRADVDEFQIYYGINIHYILNRYDYVEGELVDRVADGIKKIRPEVSLFEQFPKDSKITKKIGGFIRKIVLYRKGINVTFGNHKISGGTDGLDLFKKKIKICHFKWGEGIIEKLKYRVENLKPYDEESRNYIIECKKAIDIFDIDL